MLIPRAWPSALWLLAFLFLGCAKERDQGAEASSVESAAAHETDASDPDPAETPEAELPIGMDLEKGVPPWYVSGTGKIPVERLRRGINESGDWLTACSRAWDPGLGEHTAKVLVRFTIGEQGHISETAASENIGADPELVECVVQGMREIPFDPPPVGGPVTYEMPLYFAKR